MYRSGAFASFSKRERTVLTRDGDVEESKIGLFGPHYYLFGASVPNCSFVNANYVAAPSAGESLRSVHHDVPGHEWMHIRRYSRQIQHMYHLSRAKSTGAAVWVKALGIAPNVAPFRQWSLRYLNGQLQWSECNNMSVDACLAHLLLL